MSNFWGAVQERGWLFIFVYGHFLCLPYDYFMIGGTIIKIRY